MIGSISIATLHAVKTFLWKGKTIMNS